MKKVMNKVNFAIIAMMVSVPAFADVNYGPVCDLVKEFKNVFSLLRTLAFVGAAFYIAGWAWGYISSGKAELKDLKDKGIGLLVGFAILFLIGLVLSFFLSTTGQHTLGCPEITGVW